MVGSNLYFRASDGDHGNEIWRSDGTEAGTVLVKDITPGMASTYPTDLFDLDVVLLFATARGELWISDGTEAGTALVKSFEGNGSIQPVLLGLAGNIVFFGAQDEQHGQELWKTDGTTAGTVLVKDILPGPSGGFYPWGEGRDGFQNFAVLGHRLFFAAGDGLSGTELWSSDGTEAGTLLVKDISPGTWSSDIGSLVNFGGQILFGAQGNLWKTDGTEAGTVLVKKIPAPPHQSAGVQGLRVAGPWVYFLAVDDIHGLELWKSDGTPENTVLVKDIRPGNSSATPFYLTASGSDLYFFANDGTGMEPWRSDGTEAGTFRLADLNPGPGDSH